VATCSEASRGPAQQSVGRCHGTEQTPRSDILSDHNIIWDYPITRQRFDSKHGQGPFYRTAHDFRGLSESGDSEWSWPLSSNSTPVRCFQYVLLRLRNTVILAYRQPNYRVLNTCSLVAYPEQFVSVTPNSRFVHVGFVVLTAVTVTTVVHYFTHVSEAWAASIIRVEEQARQTSSVLSPAAPLCYWHAVYQRCTH
jgi:hypothetical protein